MVLHDFFCSFAAAAAVVASDAPVAVMEHFFFWEQISTRVAFVAPSSHSARQLAAAAVDWLSWPMEQTESSSDMHKNEWEPRHREHRTYRTYLHVLKYPKVLLDC